MSDQPGTLTSAPGGADPAGQRVAADRRRSRGARGLVAPLVALALVGALGLAAMTGSGGSQAEPPGGPEAGGAPADPLAVEQDGTDRVAAQQQAVDEARSALAAIATRDPDDPRALGDPDAPVVLVQWADFLCPFCGVFARDTEPTLVERYVDTGLLRIEWRDLPFQGEEALLAAIGGQAAAEQDAFWAYHEALFAADLRRGDGRIGRDFLLEVAEELELDTAAFELALDDPATEGRVVADAQLGQGLGITGTPAFIVGDRPLVGAQPLDTFVQAIEFAAHEAGVALP